MRKQLYLAIIAQLKLIQLNSQGKYITAPVPVTNPEKIAAKAKQVIKTFDVWNNQLDYIEEEPPFALPAVFLEFLPIQWEARSKGVRGADVSLTLHVVTANRAPSKGTLGMETQAFAFFDLLDAINYNLYNLKGDFFRYLTSAASATDHNYSEIIDSQETYTVQLTDKSAVRTVALVPAAPTVTTSFQ